LRQGTYVRKDQGTCLKSVKMIFSPELIHTRAWVQKAKEICVQI
jgi:hypothetical protein